MTPMIDIVFQLLAFFIMTLKVVDVEGDFYVQMPAVGPSTGVAEQPVATSLRLRLTADESGNLTGMTMGDQLFANFNDLNQEIYKRVTAAGSLAKDLELEIDTDYQLKYRYTMLAVTSVSGFRDPNGNTISLIEKIKFTPPKKP